MRSDRQVHFEGGFRFPQRCARRVEVAYWAIVAKAGFVALTVIAAACAVKWI